MQAMSGKSAIAGPQGIGRLRKINCTLQNALAEKAA
jgi:hypothetical protein